MLLTFLSLTVKLSSAIALYHRVMAEDLLSWARRAASKLAKEREILKQEAYHAKFDYSQVAILPAAIVQPASRAARLWCLVRSLNHPDNGGTGSGLVEISIDELGQWLNRSERSVWRYLREALSKGYLHSCHCEYGQLRIEYRGLKSLCKHLGLSHMGAIGVFPLEEIQHAKTRATDIVAEKLQAQSFHQMKKEWGKFARGAKPAADLLEIKTSSAKVPGEVVIARGHRLLYLEPHWRPFGGTQQTIATRLDVSVRTIQYRLSNTWRATRGISTIEKAQSAHQVFEECPKDFLQGFMRLEENASQRYVWMGRRLFKRGTNLYDTGVGLRSQRYRQAEYNSTIEFRKNVLQTESLAGDATSVLQAGSNSVLKELENPEEAGENAKPARL